MSISSVTGLPAIVVPSAVDRDGLPIGLEFLGRPFSEPTLIRVAMEDRAPARPAAFTANDSGEVTTEEHGAYGAYGCVGA